MYLRILCLYFICYIVYCFYGIYLMLINREKKNVIYIVNKVKKKSILNFEYYRILYKRKVKEKFLFFLS